MVHPRLHFCLQATSTIVHVSIAILQSHVSTNLQTHVSTILQTPQASYICLHLSTCVYNFVDTKICLQMSTIRAYSLGLSRFLMFFDCAPKRFKNNSNIKKILSKSPSSVPFPASQVKCRKPLVWVRRMLIRLRVTPLVRHVFCQYEYQLVVSEWQADRTCEAGSFIHTTGSIEQYLGLLGLG